MSRPNCLPLPKKHDIQAHYIDHIQLIFNIFTNRQPDIQNRKKDGVWVFYGI